MLKPAVLDILFDVYRTGAVVILLAAFALGIMLRRLPSPAECRWRDAFPPLGLAVVYVVVYRIGLAVDAKAESFHLGWLSAACFLHLFASRNHAIWRWVVRGVTVPVFLALGFAAFWATDPSGHWMFPFWETQIAPALVCRQYPQPFDSVQGHRLALLRIGDGIWHDEVLAEIKTVHEEGVRACTLAPDGRSVFLSLHNVRRTVSLDQHDAPR